MLSLCSSPVFVLIFIVYLGTNFVVSAFYIFLKLFSLFCKIIWSHRELPLSSFLLSAFFVTLMPISSPCQSFFQLSFLFFHCYLHFIPPSPLNGDHGWDHVHCKRRGSVCSGTSEDSREAGTNRSWVTGSNHLPPHSVGAVSSGMSGWALSEHCSIPMEQQHYYEGGKHDWWRPVYRMNNTANQQERGERVLKPGSWCQGGDYSGWSSTIVTEAMGCEYGEDAD